MTFDPTITAGNVISIVTTIAVIGAATIHLGSRVGKMEMKLNMIWKWYLKSHQITNGD